jgi:hypothetical protein
MRRRNRRAFWKAVQSAAGNEGGLQYAKKVHPIWGLRAIRDFEKVNGVEFDPHDDVHRFIVAGKGRALIMLRYMRCQVDHLAQLSDALARAA